jgi:molybdopterin-biosynthesis enzyme MoeA-like protein
VRNVFILPGVPNLMKRKFLEIEHQFHGVRPSTGSWVFRGRESHYTEEIDALVAAFPSLAIGSYPRKVAGEHTVMLTFEGYEEGRVAQAMDWARERFPALNRA